MTKCQVCGSPATRIITEIFNGEETRHQLCESCLKDTSINPLDSAFKNAKVPDPEDALKSIQKALTQHLPEAKMVDITKECPECGVTALEMAKVGKVGCTHCYDFFQEELEAIIKRVQQNRLQHVGKIPTRSVSVKRQIEMLIEKMNKVVDEEKYEEAATFRDQINELKEKE